MDVAQYARILWRFRAVVVVGVVLATLFAVLSTAKFDAKHGLTYRQSETWSSTASIFITQQGFPLGRAFYDRVVPLPNGQNVGVYQDPYRFSNYAVLYAGLATSDEARRVMAKAGPITGIASASVR